MPPPCIIYAAPLHHICIAAEAGFWASGDTGESFDGIAEARDAFCRSTDAWPAAKSREIGDNSEEREKTENFAQ